MGLRSKKRVEPSELRRGDQIYTDRMRKTYDHHGIYVGDDRVIHFSRISPKKGSKYICTHGLDDVPFPTTTDNTSAVRKSCVSCFRRMQKKRHQLYRYEYDGGFWAMLRVHSSRTHAQHPDVVVERAYKSLCDQDFGEYNLILNNCETFAFYCKTGKKRISKQVMHGAPRVAAGCVFATS